MVNAGKAGNAGEKRMIYLLFLKIIKKITENLAASPALPARTKQQLKSSFVFIIMIFFLNNFCVVPGIKPFSDNGEGESRQY